jgi:hypothetical protein
MVKLSRLLSMLCILTCIPVASSLICKSFSHDDPVCIPKADSYISPEVECCNSLLDIPSYLPNCSSYFIPTNSNDSHHSYTYKCDSITQVQIIPPTSRAELPRNSRILYPVCISGSNMSVSLNIYTVNSK